MEGGRNLEKGGRGVIWRGEGEESNLERGEGGE